MNLNVLIPPYLRNLDEPTPCAGRGDLFFGPGRDDEAAKTLCGRCPVRQACLEHAIAVGETRGVWGGLTPSERGIPPEAQRPACGTERRFQQHRARREDCARCQTAHDDRVRAQRETDLAAAVHGTDRALQLERRLGRPACGVCLAGERERHRARRAARRLSMGMSAAEPTEPTTTVERTAA